MAKTFQMGQVKIPAFFIYVGHVHLQYAETGWGGIPFFCYPVYFIPSHVSLKKAIAFEYGTSFFIQPSGTYLADDDDDVIALSAFPL